MRVSVKHWRYEDGWRPIPHILRESYGKDKEFDKFIVGWHCWVYTNNDREFVEWMDNNMKHPYNCDHRFNSGDPMYTIFITHDEDATLFKLRWM